MSDENANVGETAESTENTDTSKKVTEKISEYSGKVDALVESALGFIGNRPWDSWLDTANKYISKFLPAAIALAGVLACLTCLITMLKNDAPFSYVVKTLFILVPVRFAMHLAPKALALTRSFIEKGEPAVIRPELMYIMKVICGIGGILLGVYLLLDFDKDLVVPAIVAIIFAVLMIICLERPGIVGVKPDYPVNCVEEVGVWHNGTRPVRGSADRVFHLPRRSVHARLLQGDRLDPAQAGRAEEVKAFGVFMTMLPRLRGTLKAWHLLPRLRFCYNARPIFNVNRNQ